MKPSLNYFVLRVLKFVGFTLMALTMSACGGGGGGGGGGGSSTPPPKAWGTAVLIETDNTGDASRPQVAMDVNGNALAVWRQFDGTRDNIMANRYDVNTGWGMATLIETDNTVDSSSPQVAMDVNGNALAVWIQFDGTRFNIMANRYDVNTGWGMATLIETDNTGDASSPQVAMDVNGNALAVWNQYDGTRDSIMANRYDVNTGWGMATLIETDNTGNANNPQVAIDVNGNGLAVWQQFDGTRDNIMANRYDVNTGWGMATLIETDNTGNANNPQVAIDVNGNGLAVWQQFDGTRDNIMANRYDVNTGWGMATLIETDNAGDADDPQVAFDASGNALAVWNQFDGTEDSIMANRYDVNTGWGMATLIETDNAGGAYQSQVAFAANGNALAVWNQFDGLADSIWANRYDAQTGWGTAALIETDNVNENSRPQVAIDVNGNGLAVWQQFDGTGNNIWSNSYR